MLVSFYMAARATVERVYREGGYALTKVRMITLCISAMNSAVSLAWAIPMTFLVYNPHYSTQSQAIIIEVTDKVVYAKRTSHYPVLRCQFKIGGNSLSATVLDYNSASPSTAARYTIGQSILVRATKDKHWIWLDTPDKSGLYIHLCFVSLLSILNLLLVIWTSMQKLLAIPNKPERADFLTKSFLASPESKLDRALIEGEQMVTKLTKLKEQIKAQQKQCEVEGKAKQSPNGKPD